MKLLVTGGAGFIGSAFVRRRLAATEDRIVVLDKLTYAGNRANLAPAEKDPALSPRLHFVRGDICDAKVVAELVGEADAVVNFAAETHVDRSIQDAAAFLRTGVIGLHMLLEAVRAARAAGPRARTRRFVQVSTDEVYGSVETGSSSEDAPLQPRSPYAAAKAAGDLLALAYHATHGLNVVVSRGANTYGPYQHPEKLIPLFITNALADEPLPLYGDGEQRRDWLYVDDHADAISTLLERGAAGTAYNIPAGQEHSNREVTAELLARLDKPWSLVRHVADRLGHDRRYAMDGARITALGWRPAVDFATGMRRTVEWYREHRDWWSEVQDAEWDLYYERTYSERLAEAGRDHRIGDA